MTMRKTPVWIVVAGVLLAGCGGGSDSSNSGDSHSSGGSAGDAQYIDPFAKKACLSMRDVHQKIDRIASQVQNPERKQKAIHAVRDHAC
jgi:hypothetical protein